MRIKRTNKGAERVSVRANECTRVCVCVRARVCTLDSESEYWAEELLCSEPEDQCLNLLVWRMVLRSGPILTRRFELLIKWPLSFDFILNQ